MSSPKDIDEFIKKAHVIVIMQADNPDADSLGSTLALEQILHELKKEPILYCGVNIPSYLHYLNGWDRVVKDLPKQFDASIVVDASAGALFDSLEKSSQKGWLSTKPGLIIDHHESLPNLDFARLIWNKPAAATGEHIYELATKLNWPLNKAAAEMLAASILSDSLGLSSQATTPRTIHILAELVEKGANLAKLDQRRRDSARKTPEIISYKSDLLKRIEYFGNGRIASVTIPWAEIEKFSHDYNPAMLVIDEMRSIEGVDLAVVFKHYRDGKITAKIRSNYGYNIAGQLAEQFGGGGHSFAAGFKITDGRSFEQIKQQTLEAASQLLEKVSTK